MYIHVETIGQSSFGAPIQAFHLSGLEGMGNTTFSNVEGLFPNKEKNSVPPLWPEIPRKFGRK